VDQSRFPLANEVMSTSCRGSRPLTRSICCISHICTWQEAVFQAGLRSWNRLEPYSLGSLEPEPYSEYGPGFGYKKMKQKTRHNSTNFLMIFIVKIPNYF
jgi:hypothetical protein